MRGRARSLGPDRAGPRLGSVLRVAGQTATLLGEQLEALADIGIAPGSHQRVADRDPPGPWHPRDAVQRGVSRAPKPACRRARSGAIASHPGAAARRCQHAGAHPDRAIVG